MTTESCSLRRLKKPSKLIHDSCCLQPRILRDSMEAGRFVDCPKIIISSCFCPYYDILHINSKHLTIAVPFVIKLAFYTLKMYLCVCIHTHKYIYTHTHTHVCILTYMYICMYVCNIYILKYLPNEAWVFL